MTEALAAFGVLVTRHDPHVTSLVARLAGSGCTENDINSTVQAVFLQAWQAFSVSRSGSDSIWLYRLAARQALKQWRRRQQTQTVFSEELPVSVRDALTSLMPGPANAAALRARDKDLSDAIDQLPERQRAVVLLHYFEDYSCEDVARILNRPVSAAWSDLYEACRSLSGAAAWLGE